MAAGPEGASSGAGPASRPDAPRASFPRLLRQTVSDWLEHGAFRLAAALAYYTLFSLAPLLVVMVAIVGVAFGEEAARGRIFSDLRGLLGDSSAATLQGAVSAAAIEPGGGLATVLGILTLLIGATAMFAELQDALNTIWRVRSDPTSTVRDMIRRRLLSMAMVVVIGFLLLVSLLVSAAINALGGYVGGVLPLSSVLIELANFALSFAVTTLLFAALFKVLPDVEIAWRDVWIGGVATAAMFTLGKSLIGMYLGRAAVGSAYGAAGSLAVLLVWIYYSSLILYLGAEFTHVFATTSGSVPPPPPGRAPADAGRA